MEIKPTVGRVLLFVPRAGDPLFHEGRLEELASQVCYVHENGSVNLVVFDREGTPHPRQSVFLLQPDEDTIPQDSTCYAHWMPYQKGQAAKNDELAPVVEKLKADVAEAKDLLDRTVATVGSHSGELSAHASSISGLSSRLTAVEQKFTTAANSAGPA